MNLQVGKEHDDGYVDVTVTRLSPKDTETLLRLGLIKAIELAYESAKRQLEEME